MRVLIFTIIMFFTGLSIHAQDFANFPPPTNPIEAAATLRPAEGLLLRATSNIFDGKVIESNDAKNVDEPIQAVPEQIHTLMATYTLPKEFGGTINFRQVGRFYSGTPDLFIDGHTLTEVMVSYRGLFGLDQPITIFAGVSNIFDEAFVSSAANETSWVPGTPRAFRIGMAWAP